MGLDFAIDALYATDFQPQDAQDCRQHKDGRKYPTAQAVAASFTQAGRTLHLHHVQLFDCYRAQWHATTGEPAGAVVGQSADEAAVYALAILRRQLSTMQSV
jgi:hypothetical protein